MAAASRKRRREEAAALEAPDEPVFVRPPAPSWECPICTEVSSFLRLLSTLALVDSRSQPGVFGSQLARDMWSHLLLVVYREIDALETRVYNAGSSKTPQSTMFCPPK